MYQATPTTSPPGSSTLIIYFIEQDDIVPNRVIDIDLDDVYRCFRIPGTHGDFSLVIRVLIL